MTSLDRRLPPGFLEEALRADALSGLTVSFATGEEMRTEISAKFRRSGVESELAAAGFTMRSWWTDFEGQFGLSLSAPG